MYVVINTMHADDNHLGQVLSNHLSEEAAERAAAKYQSQVRRANGKSSYVPLSIVELTGRAKPASMVPRSAEA